MLLPRMPPRDSLLFITTLSLTLFLLASPSPADAQHRHEDPEQPRPPRTVASAPGHEHAQAEAEAVLCDCPLGREGSGTSWQPDATSVHLRTFALGDWQLAAHAQVSAVFADEDGPRGDDKFFSTNHVMISGHRRAGAGVFGLRSMWSLEPAMGRRGYPLLLQTGETADGVTPLVDRQHPHDLPMELAATYSRPFGDDRGLYLYAAAVGTPALGPPTFMHRASAVSLPVSPITHHWFDSSHVTFGVVTLGVIVSPKAKIEASVFRGREPDQERWGFEKPGLDSFSFRLSVNPTPYLALQVSGGQLDDAEQLHPGADMAKLTASAMFSRQWTRLSVDALAAWGRNKRSPSSFPVPGGIYFMPGAVAQAALLEATVRVATRHALVGRFEHADKDELFPLNDPRHITLFGVTRATAGYVFDVVRTSDAVVGIGGAASWNRVASDARADYGGSPRAFQLFVNLSTH
jgi:hypothetical protein